LSDDTLQLFLGITPPFEALLTEELTALGHPPESTFQGGVECHATPSQLWHLAHHTRLAESIRVRVGRFRAHRFDAFSRPLGRLPWTKFFPRDTLPHVKVTSRKSALYHTGAIAERTTQALASRLLKNINEPSKAPAARGEVFVRIVRDHVQVSIDAIGEPLHRRGYRQAIGKAPLRETLAAATVYRLVQDPSVTTLWDPFCGSGTLLIEAAALRAGQPTALDRAFAFTQWPGHDAPAYRAFVDALSSPSASLNLWGSDIDAKELDAARANAARAGLVDQSQWHGGDVASVVEHIPAGAAIVANLPYGQRTRGGDALRGAFARFGKVLCARQDWGPVWVINGHRSFRKATGLDWTVVARFQNRGLHVELLTRPGSAA